MRKALVLFSIALAVTLIQAKKLSQAERLSRAGEQNMKSRQAWLDLYKSSSNHQNPQEVEKQNAPAVGEDKAKQNSPETSVTVTPAAPAEDKAEAVEDESDDSDDSAAAEDTENPGMVSVFPVAVFNFV